MGQEGGQYEKEEDRQRQRKCHQPPLQRPFEHFFRRAVVAGLIFFLQGHLGREEQAANPQSQGVPQQCQTAQEGHARQTTAVDARVKRFGVNDDVALRVAHGHGEGARTTHHDAFDDGLAAIVDRGELGRIVITVGRWLCV